MTKCGRILRYAKNDVKNRTVHDREDLGTRLSYLDSDYKMAEHFTRFTRKK